MEGVISKIDAMTMEPDQRQMEMDPQESEIMKLPNEVLETIFLMLPGPDVRNVALVCRRFSEIVGKEPFLFQIFPVSDSYNVKKLVKSCVQKMAEVKEVYPRASFEFYFNLEYEDDEDDWEYPLLKEFSWMQQLVPFAKDIVKLTLCADIDPERDFKDLIELENLEVLDLDLGQWGFIEEVKADDWNKFSPNLSVLRIKLKQDFELDSAVKFVDLMCRKFRNLKEISIGSDSEMEYTHDVPHCDFEDITNDFPKAPTEDENKFPMLTKIKIVIDCFKDEYETQPAFIPILRKLTLADETSSEEDKAMKSFQNYLIAKCPKLEKPIQMKIKYDDCEIYVKYTFENDD